QLPVGAVIPVEKSALKILTNALHCKPVAIWHHHRTILRGVVGTAFLKRHESTTPSIMAASYRQSKTSNSSAGITNTGPAPIARFIASAAGHALSRGNTVIAELQAHWPGIAGPALASCTAPAKITKAPARPGFPRKDAPPVLHLMVESAKALEVQYSFPQLVERINQTLGFNAISELRILQFPPGGQKARSTASLTRPALKICHEQKASRLEAALVRMSAGVKGGKHR
ncbi:MAG TPA: DciA family protein, partial [Hyphomicrobiales bacterium]|nr:DciA family protein [Hyphomicrobiales bacterium]